MKWFQVDADTPNDPKIRAVERVLGTEGIGGLFLLWCFIADHGVKRPGWSLNSLGRPIPIEDLRDGSRLDSTKFEKLVEICVESGHFDRRQWTMRSVIAIPAMASRADTYTRRRVRSEFEHSSNDLPTKFANKTTHTKTRHNPKKRTRLAPHAPESTPDESRKVIRALVFDLVKRAEPHSSFADLKDMAKAACAEKDGIAYDAEVVGSALEQALARRRKVGA